MGMALRNSGRDIVFSACNWGNDDVHKWIRESGANMYRSTGDIQDSLASIQSLAMSQIGNECYGGVYCHNDIDMLVVGMYGGSNNEFIASKLGGCTDTEYKSHFSLWAIMNSPLMIGCDVRKMNEATKTIPMNQDVIAINKDEECRGAYCIKQWNNPEHVMALIKPLSNGDYAIGMFNFSDKPSEMSLQFWDIGLPTASGRGLSMYDCWEHKELGTFTERYVTTIESHDCVVLRAKVVKVN